MSRFESSRLIEEGERSERHPSLSAEAHLLGEDDDNDLNSFPPHHHHSSGGASSRNRTNRAQTRRRLVLFLPFLLLVSFESWYYREHLVQWSRGNGDDDA